MTIDSHEEGRPLDLASFRQQLATRKGREYWRSLNELAESEEFEEAVRQEFPRQAVLLGSLNRRDFLKVLGASLALAGLTACVPQNAGKILPYAVPPEALVPGKPVFFATAMPFGGYGQGVLAKSEMGRPIKVEGNPRHPVTQGASNLFMQASILDLYDPDRAKSVTNQGQPSTWDDFVAAVGAAAGANAGAGLRILTGTVTSPSLAEQLNAILAQFPQAKWHQYDPVGRDTVRAGAALAFNQPVDVHYRFDLADVILSLDSDFLFREPGSVKYGRDFSARRQPTQSDTPLSRLYVVESSLTLTGSNADHRLGVKPSQVEGFARALAARLGIDAGGAGGEGVPGENWLDALAADLQSAGEAALVVAGERQPAAVHMLAHAINEALGAVGNTVVYTDPVELSPVDQLASLRELASDLDGGQVDLLVILGGNPVYSAPADLSFAEAMPKAGTSVYLGMYADETAALATWHVPAAHFLEMWGDIRAVDGTVSIIQPLIEPLYGGKSPQELLAALSGQGTASGYLMLREYWQANIAGGVQPTPSAGEEQPTPSADETQPAPSAGGDFETVWQQALSDGMLPNTSLAATSAPLQVNLAALPGAAAAPNESLEVVFEPDPTIWDGEFANNAWLQELPKPLTKLTWDNAALFSPQTAEGLGLQEYDLVELSLRGRSVTAAVFIQPGQPVGVVTLSLGYGRAQGGNVLAGTGFNANAIRTSEAPWFDSGLEVRKTGGTYQLVTTRDHTSMENRNLVRSATLEEFMQHPAFAQEGEGELPSLYDPVQYPGHAWGMAINLNTCIGCNACVIACQAENNIPTVGKDQVDRSREMHWLRIDRYFKGSPESPEVFFEPVPCMHCENAPCEPVCPVEATSHSAEGLNEMTYNRCVGTRYCSNNCPYKVRRFNFYKYVDDVSEPLKALRNPDVSVRSRGVMEKCTYCVQRITAARVQAEVEGRTIQDGEIRTACQQACPTNAIVFGDINDANSQVRQLKETPLNYALLGELGTRPRTTYLAKVKNPNPAMVEQA